MPSHNGKSPSDIVGYDGLGNPIYRTHGNTNRAMNNNGVRNRVTRRNGNGTGANGGRRMVGGLGTGNGNQNVTTSGNNNNPVIRTFFAPQSPRYFRPNGQIVPVGAPLHEHQNGTIMTQHAMGPNDNSVVVTTSRPPNQARSVNNRRTTRARTNMMMNNRVNRTAANRVNRRTTTRRMGGRGGTSY